jgi:hypothetical protein
MLNSLPIAVRAGATIEDETGEIKVKEETGVSRQSQIGVEYLGSLTNKSCSPFSFASPILWVFRIAWTFPGN